jgi:hypothetical protein
VLKYSKKIVHRTKRKKDRWTRARGKGDEDKWVEVEPGRYFVETRHEKGKRWPDHAFEEVLIIEEGIPKEFSRLVEVKLDVVCRLHGSVRFVCQFWKKGWCWERTVCNAEI